jgi:hypothetical protein
LLDNVFARRKLLKIHIKKTVAGQTEQGLSSWSAIGPAQYRQYRADGFAVILNAAGG